MQQTYAFRPDKEYACCVDATQRVGGEQKNAEIAPTTPTPRAGPENRHKKEN
jgi:hypothetical protein